MKKDFDKNMKIRGSVYAILLVFAIVIGLVPMQAKAGTVTKTGVTIAERIPMSSATPSQINSWAEGKGYGIERLYDGNRTDGYYMSKAYTSATPKEAAYVDIVLSGKTSVTRVDVYTLANGSTVREFPESFTVSAWMGNTWEPIATGYQKDLQVYATNILKGSVAFDTVITDKLRITASTLGVGGDGNYYFNMRELEVYGRSNILHDTDSVEAETEGWSSLNYGPQKLVDAKIASGNFYTSAYEETADTTKEVTIHFDDTYRLDGVNLFPRLENGSYKCGFPVDFTISVRLKSGIWKQVYQATDVVADSYGKTFSFSPESCTAVKLSVTKLSLVDGGPKYALQLAEIEALGTKNLVLDADIAAEHPEWATAFMPFKMNDGMDENLYTSTYSTKENEVKTVYITMDHAYSVNRIWLTPRVLNGVVYGFPVDFTIDLWDGEAWRNVVSETGFTTPGATDTVDFYFDDVICRGLRLTVTKLGASDSATEPYVLQMGEIDVFGTDTEDTAPIYRQGDVDADDAVNQVDLTLLKEQLLDGEATDLEKQYANVNSDSAVNVKDLVRFKKLQSEWSKLEIRERCVYYVDADHGSDENDGRSASTAIQSINKVNTLPLRAGDQVLFKRGCTWNCTADNQLLITQSGRDGRPITYGAYGTTTSLPVINGAENVAETVRAVDVSHVIINGLEIQNKTTEETSTLEEYRRGIYVLAETKLVEDVVIQNCVVQNVRSNTALMPDDVSDDARWYGGIIVQGAGNHARASILKNVRVLNNTVACNHNSGIAVGSKTSSSRKSIGVKVDSNRVKNNWGDGIIMFACDGEQGEGSTLQYSIMQRNVLDKNGTYGAKDRYFGGLWTIYSNHVLIQYNSVSNQCATGDGVGYDIDGACDNVIMQYNYSNNNEGGFLLLVNFRSGTTIVRNNVSVNDKTGFLKLWLHEDVTDYSGLSAEIYNNTYYTTENTNGLVWVDNASEEGYDPIGTLTDKVHLRNNIFCYEGSDGSISTTNDDDTSGNYQGYFNFDYNCYCGIVNVKTAGGTHSITDDPMFVNPGVAGADNYKLKAGSPCINKGTMIDDNGGLDYWGNELDDTLNIGAYGAEQ